MLLRCSAGSILTACPAGDVDEMIFADEEYSVSER